MLSRVFITSANAKKIIVASQVDAYQNAEALWHRPLFWSSFTEANRLKAYRELLRNPNAFLHKFKPLENVTDTFRYLRPEQYPSYHQDKNCEGLKAKFIGFVIPDAIRGLGPVRVDEFRTWVKNKFPQVYYTNQIEDQNQFRQAIKNEFKVEEVKFANDERDNKGIREVVQGTKEEMVVLIENLFDDEQTFFNDNPQWQHVINELGPYAYLGNGDNDLNYRLPRFSDKDVRSFLREYQKNFKAPITEALQVYFRIVYNPDLNFEPSFLGQLKFRACAFCSQNEVIMTL